MDEKTKSTVRRFDLVTSIVLIIFSIWLAYESYKLFANPFGKATITDEEIVKNLESWYTSPGLIPIIICGVLLVLSIALLVTAIKDGARFDFFTKEKIATLKTNRELKTFVTVVGTLAIYIYGLIPLCRSYLHFFYNFQGFPFAIATSIYVSGIAIIYQRERTKRNIIISIIVGISAAFIITVLFNKVALIMLP